MPQNQRRTPQPEPEPEPQARGWRPEKGDIVAGRIVELEQGWSDQQNSHYPILVIRTEDDELVNVHCFHAVLRNRLQRIAPGPGDRIEITFKGMGESKAGRPVALYDVVAPDRKQDGRAFWQGIGASHPNRDRPIASDDDETDLPF